MSSGRCATILGSSKRKDPAAAFRVLEKGDSPVFTRCSLILPSWLFGINTSPRTSNILGVGIRLNSFSFKGIDLIVRILAVTSSPKLPSPRVKP